jgi:rhodanese-related sulfurtransferase
MPNLLNELSVIAIPAAAPQVALSHFERILSLETDCWDVHAAVQASKDGFVLLDVRSPESFGAGHVPTAINLPHRRINQRNLAKYPKDALFVVYCNGPHCNGADKAAARLARLGRRVKKMIGGIEGWNDEGFALVTGANGAPKQMTQRVPKIHSPQSVEIGGTQ